jgi:hypothetical protein
MRIAAIAIATADLGSDGGVIDGCGCARVHWRGRAMFPAAGDGSGTFVFRRHLRRSLHVYVQKCAVRGPPSGGGLFRREGVSTRRLKGGRESRPSTRARSRRKLPPGVRHLFFYFLYNPGASPRTPAKCWVGTPLGPSTSAFSPPPPLGRDMRLGSEVVRARRTQRPWVSLVRKGAAIQKKNHITAAPSAFTVQRGSKNRLS